MKTACRLIITLVACLPAVAGLAAEKLTEHTWRLADGEEPPPATLADAAFLVGAWEGEAFGGRFEEVWNPPSAGSMVGMFKLFDEDGVAFYELMLITVEGGTLSLKVRHFNADFTAWEEKGDYVEFRLVAMDEHALHFGGLSFYRRGPDSLEAYIAMQNDSGVREEKLTFTRRPP
jgi:hypothetical protein